MIIGVPKEVKNNEYRVAITPAGVAELVHRGHEVIIEHQAGAGSSFDDNDFKAAGAQIFGSAAEVWDQADMILKVKEPIEQEYELMKLGAKGSNGDKKGQVLFTFLHLAASRACTDALLSAGTTSIAYETVQAADGSLPLLAPMSEVAGRLAPQVGAVALMKSAGGRGVLMGGVPGTAPAEVVVIGGGVSGVNAATIAVGMGAHVTVFDLDINKLRAIDARFGGRVATRYSTTLDLHEAIKNADLVIGAVLIPGAKAPMLVPNSLVAQMKPGSVLVDIAIDQGGCFEDSRPTTHDDPTFTVHDSVFYCVANMPGSVARTSTMALTNATLPFVLKLADKGWKSALQSDASLAKGLSTHDGELLCPHVSEALDIELGSSPLV
ncbi:alanine dehydrogenase [Gordonia sp. TBRC 11910]|uniref:Alanine dehydrogenase n=1 Tax=Gordonia asplenii TaxID=2725283 RepID=A0A848KTX3_9ACTN|nr:alanine dehydrogenase [Gordonia asplenii]NMO01639.1 alanine dehydrogenase [Gordonia asplenii]